MIIIVNQLLNPEFPLTQVHEANLENIKFPLVFLLCATNQSEEANNIFKKFGYENEERFFIGQSMYNRSISGWSGHLQNKVTTKGKNVWKI